MVRFTPRELRRLWQWWQRWCVVDAALLFDAFEWSSKNKRKQGEVLDKAMELVKAGNAVPSARKDEAERDKNDCLVPTWPVSDKEPTDLKKVPPFLQTPSKN